MLTLLKQKQHKKSSEKIINFLITLLFPCRLMGQTSSISGINNHLGDFRPPETVFPCT